MAKKRLRNHTNPLNFRDRLTSFSDHVNHTDYDALDFEIGFGRGRFIESYALRHPYRFAVAVEVRKNMVELFKERVQLPNLLPIWGAAQICIEDTIPDQSLSRVFIFHPDPWFKNRHFKRRVLQPELLILLQQKLITNGMIYISTDVEELYEAMMDTCQQSNGYQLLDGDPFWETDYQTHWSMFSEKDQRSQFFITLKKESI